MALSIRLPCDAETRLKNLAALTGRSKTFYVTEAIVEHLDDLEDLYLAEQRLIDIRAGKSNISAPSICGTITRSSAASMAECRHSRLTPCPSVTTSSAAYSPASSRPCYEKTILSIITSVLKYAKTNLLKRTFILLLIR